MWNDILTLLIYACQMSSIEEAQVNVWECIQTTLIDLAVDDDMTEEEIEELEDSLGNAADLIIEALELRVTSIGDGTTGTAEINVSSLLEMDE